MIFAVFDWSPLTVKLPFFTYI